MTPRHLAMGAALLLAAGLVLFGDRTPSSDVAEAVERTPARTLAVQAAPGPVASRSPRGAAGVTGAAEPVILRLTERSLLIGADDEAIGAGGNLFGAQNWTPPVAAQAASEAPPPPPPPPTAPPLPFTYLGKAAGEGSWEVYLARGDKTYNVRDKDVIDGVYRVDAIAPPTMTLTYLPLNQVQQLNIGVLD